MSRKGPMILAAALIPAAFATGCKNQLAEADELLATGDPEGAAAIYRARLEKDPGDGAGTIGLAQALYTAALEKAKTGADTVEQWNEVVEAMDAAVVVDPPPEGVAPVTDAQYADALARAGLARFEAGDRAGAAEALEKAAEEGKKTAQVYATLARSHAGTGDVEKALEAAYKAAEKNPRDVELLREAAGWAAEADLPWIHHHYFYLAEQVEPVGFEFMPPTEIAKGLTKKYGALNMVGDTLGLFLFNEEVDSRAWEGIEEREALISDMDKFLTKPSKHFAAADKPRLPWVVYHYYNTTGVVFAYLGADEKARKWLEKARDVAATGKVEHPDLQEDELEDQLGWAEANIALL